MASRHSHLRPESALGSIRELVFGLEDSLVSTLGVVIGVAAGTEDARVVLLTGVVLVVVEALSMAAGSYLSSKSHRQMLQQAINEERWEIEHEPEKERLELIEMYKERGFAPDEIEILIRRITANKDLWLEEMMAKELKINAADMDEPNKNAIVMFVSYAIGGLVPIVPFLLFPISTALVVSIVLTLAALFAMGYAKGRILDHDGLKSGTEMVAVAGTAAALGYVIGSAAGKLFGIDVA